MTDRYQLSQTWRWNLENAPQLPKEKVVAENFPGNWSWCGLSVDSPLGIAAGPLLNSRWLLYYADLGYDILVYKTVRSSARECYPLPNLVPVEGSQLLVADTTVRAISQMTGSWAVSFGMPSVDPEQWRRDIEFARANLPSGKRLVVSVVGSQMPGEADGHRMLDQLADDFATCARWAVESGADGVEANFSCPNVSTADGQLYHQPQLSGFVAERIRAAIGDSALVLKIGFMEDEHQADDLLRYTSPFINGLAMTNTVSARVSTGDRLLFDGQLRGICGDAIRKASLQQVANFRRRMDALAMPLDLIGIGGISSGAHVRQYLDAGATSVAMASSAMTDPQAGVRLRKELKAFRHHSSTNPT